MEMEMVLPVKVSGVGIQNSDSNYTTHWRKMSFSHSRESGNPDFLSCR